MIDSNYEQHYEIGIIGLSVIGCDFLQNIAENGFPVAGYDSDVSKVEALSQESKKRNIQGVENTQEFIEFLRKLTAPRKCSILFT